MPVWYFLSQVGSRNDRGWHRNRGTDSEDRRILRLRRDADAESEEGVFTCDFASDTNTPIYLGIYYPSESIHVQ